MNRGLSSKLLFVAAAATLAVAVGHGAANADVPPPPPPSSWKARNLQALPPDMPREQLIGIMRNMSSALGVNCAYCHAPASNGAGLNFASDAKREKEMARWMMRVTHDLNQKFEVDMNNPAVTCYTCHRGAAHPLIVPPPADPAATAAPPKP
jgi:hypothetical protein